MKRRNEMNLQKLKTAERQFLKAYPGGFTHPVMQALGEKHMMGRIVDMAHEYFAKKNFADAKAVAQNMVKIVTKSSMVSLFEKPRFRDEVARMTPTQVGSLADGLKGLLHGNQQRGFETLVSVLKPLKLAKWTLLTVVPNYYRPDDEVFIKPTTVKGVIEHFELKGITYSAQPTWAFYAAYRDAILDMKSKVDPSLSPSNAAFSGFLMMTCESCGMTPSVPGIAHRIKR